MDVLLYNSTVCRLCGEENENGSLLYTSDASGQNLSDLINAYLPLKVFDDGQLPRTVCPGCAITVEATVEFLDLIIKGQKIIRELYQRELEYKKKSIITEVIPENIIYEINANGQVYQVDHPLSLQVAGIDKPKRKRGRPPKKHKTPEEIAEEEAERERLRVQEDKKDDEETNGKRRRKTPTRFREAVQGKELEKIFKEEGVIDASESDTESKEESALPPKPEENKEPEVIGLMESAGELVEIVVVKGRKRGRPKGRNAQNESCGICGMTFTSLGRYMSHIAAHGPVRFECGCGELCDTREEFTKHQGDTGHEGQRVIQLNKQQPTPTTVEKPAPAPQPTPPATEEPAKEDPPQPLETEAGETQDKPEEAVVDVLTSAESEAQGEEQSQPIEPPPEEPPADRGKLKLKCNLCDKMFSNKQSKSMHMKATHAGERPYVCGVCGAAFPYPRSLTLHAIRHRRPDPARGYACDLCGKVLNHPSSVVYHKEAAHARRQYVCLKCGKGFKHKQLLQRHQLVHSQLRPFSCLLCSATFKTKANLVNHQLLHSGERRFPCGSCPQRFAHKTSLTLHMRLHAGIKPYTCTECGKTFSQKGNLSEHMRTHSGEKPYSCGECARAFTTSSQRRLHARRHARAAAAAAAAAGTGTTATAAAGGPGAATHRCPTCARVLPDRAALTRHVRRHHAASSNKQPKQRVEKQLSLLTTQPRPPSPPAPPEEGERVIYVTYEEEGGGEFHILEGDQEGEWQLQESLGELEPPYDTELSAELPASTEHIAVTDEAGNPLHFTMQDGTRLAITSGDGRSLHVVTGDGRTIPVEINHYEQDVDIDMEPEGVVSVAEADIELKGAQLEGDAPVAHYFVV